jgi:hypothetical protein
LLDSDSGEKVEEARDSVTSRHRNYYSFPLNFSCIIQSNALSVPRSLLVVADSGEAQNTIYDT